MLAHLSEDTSLVRLGIGLVLMGAGLGLGMPPATTAITEALPDELQNTSSAVNDLARELGGALGIALLGSVLTAGYQAEIDPAGLPTDAAQAVESSLAGAVAVSGQLGGQVGEVVLRSAESAFVNGLHLALLTAAIVTALAALSIGVLLRRRGRG